MTKLDFSLGAQIRSDGVVRSVVWNSAAFRAGVSPGTRIQSINGRPFSRATLLGAMDAPELKPIRLTLQDSDMHRNVTIADAGRLRYPHLERIPGVPDRLTPLLAPR